MSSLKYRVEFYCKTEYAPSVPVVLEANTIAGCEKAVLEYVAMSDEWCYDFLLIDNRTGRFLRAIVVNPSL